MFTKLKESLGFIGESRPVYQVQGAVQTNGTYSYSLGGKTVNVTDEEVKKYGNIAKAGKAKMGDVNLSATVIAPPEPKKEPKPLFKTVEEEAKYAIDADIEDTATTYKDLFGYSGGVPKTIEEQVSKLTEQQQKQREFMATQSGLASGIESSQIKRAEKESAASVAGTTAAMAQGREGAMAGSAPTIVSEFQQTAAGIIKESKDRIRLAESQREQAKYNMENAQGEARIAAAEAYKRASARAASEIRAAETTLLDAQGAASAEARANFAAFSGLVDNGTVLDTNSISSFAQQLGIPFEMANSYYEGSQRIRDDKNLDLEQKQVEMAQLNEDFENGWLGEKSKEAKSVQFYQQAANSGLYSQTQLQEMASTMGISNENNPTYMAQLKMDQASAAIKQYEADHLGQPPAEGTSDWYDYQINKLEYQKAQEELFETTGGFSVSTANEITGSTITQKYDTDISYGIPGQRAGKHDGLDYVLAGGMGADVRVPISGTARIVNDPNPGVNKGWGNQVIVTDKEGRDHMFGHLANIQVNNGDFVNAGTIIGGQGNTGYTSGKTGIHVDYRIKQDGKYINPETFLNNPPVSTDQSVISTLPEKTIDNVRSEANSFRQEAIVKTYSDVLNKKMSVEAMVGSGLGGPADLAIVFEFMKALDPTSVVRESEYEAASAAGNIFAGTFAKFNGYLKPEGGFLPDTVKEGFLDLVDVKMDSSTKQYENLYNQYSKRINNIANANVADEVLTDYRLTEGAEELDFDSIWDQAGDTSTPAEQQQETNIWDNI